MEASSITQHVLKRVDVREWAWWQLPGLLRSYVGLVVLSGIGLTAFAAIENPWHLADLGKFFLLLGCGLVSVVATPRTAYLRGGMTRDFITAWVLPIAILLPPMYAMVAPIPLLVLTQWRVHRGVVYRRVFTAAAIGLAYGAASVVFRAFPVSFAGGTMGFGSHALTWVLVVALCEQVGRRSHQALIMTAIKVTDPSIHVVTGELTHETLQADFIEFNLGVLITIVVAVSPVLAVLVVPMWLMVRRFVMHSQLLAQARLDTKTGLLNAMTWEREAAVEVERAVRTGTPLAVALVDIDHFKQVNDTYGHLVGDRVLRAVVDGLRSQLRGYDLAGRFGGEEFILLLPQAREADARAVAERLREYVASLEIPIDDEPDCCIFVRLTISVGVAALDGEQRELTDLMAAADAAMYYAKETGRNRTHVITSRAAS
jgi:diguanylate cyclase (GGDEF)-like protein